jgi:hypothetical protein
VVGYRRRRQGSGGEQKARDLPDVGAHTGDKVGDRDAAVVHGCTGSTMAGAIGGCARQARAWKLGEAAWRTVRSGIVFFHTRLVEAPGA